MLLASLSSSIMKFLVKYLYVNTNINSFEIGYWRSLISIILNLIYLSIVGVNLLSIKKSEVKYLMIRGFVGFLGLGCAFTALRLLTLSEATILFFTNPIFTTIFAFLILKERLKWYDAIICLSGFVGVVFMANPF